MLRLNDSRKKNKDMVKRHNMGRDKAENKIAAIGSIDRCKKNKDMVKQHNMGRDKTENETATLE